LQILGSIPLMRMDGDADSGERLIRHLGMPTIATPRQEADRVAFLIAVTPIR
jgi:hypothetical protein